ncbi:MAG TPA: adenylate/guanylate cyclase domain-containing protein [Gammaproteobacteria bacterium]|nr:adenylate/guanylate cyclase domain-containing protein [Gammaproteobacteria bacterium]
MRFPLGIANRFGLTKTLSSFLQDRNRQFVWKMLLISLLGSITLLVPPFSRLEMSPGLDWLFQMRGSRHPPDGVLIVTIDKASSEILHLPNLPRKWPRALHGRLVEQLSAAGAPAIGFDIIFSDPRPGDSAFAQAMARHRNVVLFDYLEADNRQGVHIETRHPPTPRLAQAALAVSPFTLPKVPEHIKQTWLFKQGAGNAPTLPVTLLTRLLAPAFPAFNRLIRNALPAESPPPAGLARQHPDEAAIRYFQLFKDHPDLARRLRTSLREAPAPLGKPLRALIFAYASGEHLILDFYGPPRTIRSIPYADALAGKLPDLRHTAVLVGFSENLQPEQKDSFYTVFTNRDGLDISGIEIAATTLGNLLEARAVTPPSLAVRLGLVLVFGLLAVWLLDRRRGFAAVGVAALIALAYLGGCWLLFRQTALWPPVTTPLLAQLPAALVLSLIGHFHQAARQRQQAHSALRYYVPREVADQALDRPPERLLKNRQKTFAACLMTDVTSFTRLSEQLSPADVHERMNAYFQLLFPLVEARQGQVIDVVGDAMLAIWHDGDAETIRENALAAATAIQKTLASGHPAALPTRMGLHCGEVSLGNIGGGKHLEYRAIGDTINTTSRIEQLNKPLGSQLLASEAICTGNRNHASRYVGRFTLRGKKQAIPIYQIGFVSASDEHEKQFEEALRYFEKGVFREATRLFQSIAEKSNDPVAQYFYSKSQKLASQLSQNGWNGGIIVK